MNLHEAEQLAKIEMSKHLWGTSWSFSWNKRKRSFGLCNYRKQEIQLSSFLTPTQPDSDVLDTIRHEIAHALTPGAGHGRKWKLVAMRLGATPLSTSSSDTMTTEERNPTWVMVAPGGKIVKEYYRKPASKMFARVGRMWVTGQQAATQGKLQLVPYAEYKRMHK